MRTLTFKISAVSVLSTVLCGCPTSSTKSQLVPQVVSGATIDCSAISNAANAHCAFQTVSIAQTDSAGKQATIKWSAPKVSTGPFTYSVYESSNGSLASVSQILSSGSQVKSNLTTTSIAATGLSSNTYFYVIATDSHGQTYLAPAAYFIGTSTNSSTSSSTTSSSSSSSQVIIPGNGGAIAASAATASGFTVSWATASDSQSSSSNLNYIVYTSTSNNISTAADAVKNGTPASVWTANITSLPITGLSPSTLYFYNVLVKDSLGNISTYTSGSYTTSPDTTPPTIGGGGTITISGSTDTTIGLTWTVATDNTTAQASLLYNVYYSTANNIVTAANVQANGTAVSGWTANLTSYTITSLTPSTTYYVNILVKDASGNISAYTSNSQATSADSTPPTVGNSGTITTASIANTTLTLNWTAATDDVTPQANLQYIVYQSSSNNISTVANAVANGTVLQTWTSNIATYNVSGLSAGTTYYFNVVVRDVAANKSAYTTVSATTTGGGVTGNNGTRYIFESTSTYTGSQLGSTTSGYIGNATHGADLVCASDGAAGTYTNGKLASNWSWNALIGINGLTMRSRINLPDTTFKNANGTTVATTETQFFADVALTLNQPLDYDRDGTSVGANLIYTGGMTSWVSGSANSSACTDWTSSNNGQSGFTGQGTGVASSWWDAGVPQTCDTASRIYCINTPPAYIFVTSTTHNGNLGGVSGADSICQTLGAAGTLSSTLGVTKWRAVIGGDGSYAGMNARDRLSLPWNINVYLVDGTTLVAADQGHLFNDSGNALTNTISKNENGAAATVSVWTGNTVGSSCVSWSSSAGGNMGTVGASNLTSPSWLSITTSPCNQTNAIYCIGQ